MQQSVGSFCLNFFGLPGCKPRLINDWLFEVLQGWQLNGKAKGLLEFWGWSSPLDYLAFHRSFEDRPSCDSLCHSVQLTSSRWCHKHTNFFCNYNLSMIIQDWRHSYLV